jgi:hypothetical protein
VSEKRGTRELKKTFRRRLSRARFLRLVGTGAGLSFVPASLAALRGRSSVAQTVGTPPILASEEYPIGLWWPPPPEKTTVERYEQIKDAGFNFVIGGNGATSEDDHPQALAAAEANGLHFLLTDNILQNIIRDSTKRSSTQGAETSSIMQQLLEVEGSRSASREGFRTAVSDPREAVKTRIQRLLERYGASPALAGLNLFDEPHRKLLGILGFAKEVLLREAGGEQLPYVNIWPSYTSLKALGTSSYREYLDLYFKRVSPPVLSFDHYPLLAKNRITGSYFYNWAVIRNYSLRFSVPSWVFIQSVGFDGSKIGLAWRRKPDENELFWQVNVSLAYGAKGIQYFTYWTPSDPKVRFGDALVTRSGQLTPLYYSATRVNNYLSVVGKELVPLTSESVVHARKERLPRGAKPFKPDQYVRWVSGSPVILSRFRPEAGTERYLLVVNHSLGKAAETRLTMSDSINEITKLDVETGQFIPVEPQGTPPRNVLVELAPGRARLYQLRSG